MVKASRLLKALLAIYAVGICLICLWVPFRTPGSNEYASRFLGYGWLWAGPHNIGGYAPAVAQVDITRIVLVLLAWSALNAAVALVTGKAN